MRLLALLAAGLFAGAAITAPVPKEKTKDEEGIVGTWKVEKYDDGDPKSTPPSAEELAKTSVTFSKDGKMVSVNPSGGKAEVEYKLDTAAKPKALDVTRDGVVTEMVYELDGDTLKICGGHGMARPTEMKADGKGVTVLTLKRMKDEKKDK